MAKYLTNKETQGALERIIGHAEKELVLVSPYIKLTNTNLVRLKKAAENGIKIKLIHRVDKLDKGEFDKLKTIKNIELKSTTNLHAKCYFNEREMIITSLNLLETSEQNWEMGILIDRYSDKEIYEDAKIDVEAIFSDSQSIQVPTTRATATTKRNAKEFKEIMGNGYCIRCKKEIPFDIEKPYCKECYKSWAEYENSEYEEKYCNSCGVNKSTTMDKPMCYDCYRMHNDSL